MFVRATLLLFCIVFNTGATDQGGVKFWREDFTMTCPWENPQWFKGNDAEPRTDGTQTEDALTLTYNDTNKGLHRCMQDGQTYYFYVEGKVCTNCFELDGKFFGGLIVADMALTGVVMFIIFRCTSKRNSSRPRTPKVPARSGGPAPPTRPGEYETLSAHTLSQDPYSAINRTS